MNVYRMQRRDFVKAGAAAAVAGLASGRAALVQASSYAEMSAVEAVAAMRNGDIKAESYAAALLDRCEALAALERLHHARSPARARRCSRRRPAASGRCYARVRFTGFRCP